PPADAGRTGHHAANDPALDPSRVGRAGFVFGRRRLLLQPRPQGRLRQRRDHRAGGAARRAPPPPAPTKPVKEAKGGPKKRIESKLAKIKQAVTKPALKPTVTDNAQA